MNDLNEVREAAERLIDDAKMGLDIRSREQGADILTVARYALTAARAEPADGPPCCGICDSDFEAWDRVVVLMDGDERLFLAHARCSETSPAADQAGDGPAGAARLREAIRPILPYLIEMGHPDEPEYPNTAIVMRGPHEWILAGDVRRLRAALTAATPEQPSEERGA